MLPERKTPTSLNSRGYTSCSLKWAPWPYAPWTLQSLCSQSCEINTKNRPSHWLVILWATMRLDTINFKSTTHCTTTIYHILELRAARNSHVGVSKWCMSPQLWLMFARWKNRHSLSATQTHSTAVEYSNWLLWWYAWTGMHSANAAGTRMGLGYVTFQPSLSWDGRTTAIRPCRSPRGSQDPRLQPIWNKHKNHLAKSPTVT